MSNETVWVGVTVVPKVKKAHTKAFETEALAQEYLEEAREKAAERDYDVWTNIVETEVETE